MATYTATAFDKEGKVLGEGHSSTPQSAATNVLWDLLENMQGDYPVPVWDIQIRPDSEDDDEADQD